MKPGRPARVDYEYERNGTANLFMMFAPLEGWRHIEVTDRHTAIDYAHVLKDLADRHFAQASPLRISLDNEAPFVVATFQNDNPRYEDYFAECMKRENREYSTVGSFN